MSWARLLGAVLLASAASCAPAGATVVPVAGGEPTTSSVPGLTPDAPFRGSAPPPETVNPWTAPPVRLTTLANGMHLAVVERHATQLVAATLYLRGGTAGAIPEVPAVVAMAVDVAFHGTAKRSERDVYETINDLFADAGTLSTDDSVFFRLRATTASFDAGLSLLRDVFVEPAFSPRVVDFERQRRVSLLPRDGDDAYRVAVRMLHVAAYGENHPYTRARMAGADALPAVTRDDLLRAWKRVVDPADATLVVAGDVDAAALAVRVGELFAAWKHDPARTAPVDVPPASPGRARLVVVDRPGAPEVTVAYGTTLAPASSPGRVARDAASELLGDMPSSSIAQTLRDKLGAAPFSTGGYAWKRGPGLWFWAGSVEKDHAADVLRALDSRVRELREQGPAAAEMTGAIERLARAGAESFETVGGIVNAVGKGPVLGFPGDELATRERKVRALTPAEVRAAVPPPDAMKAVVVGDLVSLRTQLVALGWGEIEERDTAGNVVRTFTR